MARHLSGSGFISCMHIYMYMHVFSLTFGNIIVYVYDIACINEPVEFAGEVGVVFPEMFLLRQRLLHLSLQLTDLLFHLTTL